MIDEYGFQLASKSQQVLKFSCFLHFKKFYYCIFKRKNIKFLSVSCRFERYSFSFSFSFTLEWLLVVYIYSFLKSSWVVYSSATDSKFS